MELIKRCKHKLVDAKDFIMFVVQHFIKDDCTYRASALTFTSLLAIVPLMSVGFFILSTFPVFNDLRDPIQNFIFENFVPATGKVIQEYLELFTKQVSKLSIVGVIFLFITALLVMYTVERSMNKIWRAANSRQGVSAFLLYWAILSLAPVFLGLSLAASSYLFSIPLIKGYSTESALIRFVPSIFSLIGFTFLYVVVPNCRVRIAHGFAGAIVATLLFESAKKGFAYYLSQYNTYELLYGAFATIPILFVWIYWVWVITLVGAEIGYALSVHYERRRGKPLDGISQSLLWLHRLWVAQQAGKSVSVHELINVSSKPFSVDVGELLGILTELKLIKTTDAGRYILCRDLSHVTLYDLTQRLPYPLPQAETLDAMDASAKQGLQTVLKQSNLKLQEILNVSLEKLFDDNGKAK